MTFGVFISVSLAFFTSGFTIIDGFSLSDAVSKMVADEARPNTTVSFNLVGGANQASEIFQQITDMVKKLREMKTDSKNKINSEIIKEVRDVIATEMKRFKEGVKDEDGLEESLAKMERSKKNLVTSIKERVGDESISGKLAVAAEEEFEDAATKYLLLSKMFSHQERCSNVRPTHFDAVFIDEATSIGTSVDNTTEPRQ
ncbi:Uncharacterised protein g9361 [Pycnogonum litorale]